MNTNIDIEQKKIAVVTGGTRGIGRAISLQLAEQGYHVFALYGRDRASASELEQICKEKKLSLECLRGDLTQAEKLQALIESIKAKTAHVHVVIHSAASGVHRKVSELSMKHIAWTFEINVFAIHQLLQSLLPMIPQGGRIVGITSSGGTRVIPYYAAVGASKGALEALFRHYAFELAGKGIAVNCICPGLVLTDAVEAFPDKDNRLQKTIDATPSGRLTTPEDVAQVVAFLCSPAAAQVIGQTIVVDGGKTLSS